MENGGFGSHSSPSRLPAGGTTFIPLIPIVLPVGWWGAPVLMPWASSVPAACYSPFQANDAPLKPQGLLGPPTKLRMLKILRVNR